MTQSYKLFSLLSPLHQMNPLLFTNFATHYQPTHGAN